MNVRNLIERLRAIVEPSAASLAKREAETILCHVLKTDRNRLYLHTPSIDAQTEKAAVDLAHKRRTGYPLAYILGKVGFYGRDFAVTPEVLIPRPDTETLVQAVLDRQANSPATFVDLGTGSGIIAGTLTRERPMWRATAVDISYTALRVALQNCPDRVALVCGDRFRAFSYKARFDFVVSNPPYISDKEFAELESSVTDYEPHIALKAQGNGLSFYHTLSQSTPLLKKDGCLYAEIGWNQAEAVGDIFAQTGWRGIEILPDLAGRARIIHAVCPTS